MMKRRNAPDPADRPAPDPEGESVRVVDRRPWAGREPGNGDPAPEGAESVGAGEISPRYPSYVEELRARTEAAEARVEEIREAHQKSLAEQGEFRRKLRADVGRRSDEQVGRTLENLLDVLDDLERALEHAAGSPSGGGTDLGDVEDSAGSSISALHEGVRLVRDRFLAALTEAGVERLQTAGTPFDPETAEAVRTVEVNDPALDGVVVKEDSPGYLFKDRLLRAARVAVGRAAPARSGG